ncbi:MAG: hypothetical protein ABIQ52_10045 [Vicinamibacterales bacterium]
MPPSPAAASARTPAYAWLVVGLLMPVVLLNYLDRQMVRARSRWPCCS